MYRPKFSGDSVPVCLEWQMGKVSAVLMSVGSSFHHCGAGTANNQHFVEQQMGPYVVRE